MPVSAISTSSLTVDYDGAEVLKDIEFSVRQQKLTAIVGPNGAGKSTLIKAMLGLIPIRTGSTTFFDLPLKKFQKNISYVPQRAQIDWEFPASVFDVVAMGLYSELGLLRRFLPKHKDRIRNALLDVDMADCATRQISKLSGGQQQRVAIARALCMEPRIMLFDEPTSALDPEMIAEVLEVIEELAATGMTMICVTHEMGFAGHVADQMVFMDHGRIVEMAPPKQFFSAPESERCQTFLRQILRH